MLLGWRRTTGPRRKSPNRVLYMENRVEVVNYMTEKKEEFWESVTERSKKNSSGLGMTKWIYPKICFRDQFVRYLREKASSILFDTVWIILTIDQQWASDKKCESVLMISVLLFWESCWDSDSTPMTMLSRDPFFGRVLLVGRIWTLSEPALTS